MWLITPSRKWLSYNGTLGEMPLSLAGVLRRRENQDQERCKGSACAKTRPYEDTAERGRPSASQGDRPQESQTWQHIDLRLLTSNTANTRFCCVSHSLGNWQWMCHHGGHPLKVEVRVWLGSETFMAQPLALSPLHSSVPWALIKITYDLELISFSHDWA